MLDRDPKNRCPAFDRDRSETTTLLYTERTTIVSNKDVISEGLILATAKNPEPYIRQTGLQLLSAGAEVRLMTDIEGTRWAHLGDVCSRFWLLRKNARSWGTLFRSRYTHLTYGRQEFPSSQKWNKVLNWDKVKTREVQAVLAHELPRGWPIDAPLEKAVNAVGVSDDKWRARTLRYAVYKRWGLRMNNLGEVFLPDWQGYYRHPKALEGETWVSAETLVSNQEQWPTGAPENGLLEFLVWLAETLDAVGADPLTLAEVRGLV